MEGRRGARFMCALALADNRGRIVLSCQDSVEGRLLFTPRGEGGFGYDPLFYVDAMGQTTAELSSSEKHAISHRGKAARMLARHLGLEAEAAP
jgi:XTP/dITP diphosphohydrolase